MRKIWTRLVRAFEIPFNPEDETSNRQHIIGSLINLGVLMLVVYLIPAIVERGIFAPQVMIVIAMMLFLIISGVTVRHGKAKLISVLLAISAWLFVNCIFIFFENGLRAPAYLAGMIFLIVYVGLLHGQRSVIIMTVLSLLTGVSVGFLEWKGIFLTEPKIPDIAWTIIAMLVMFPVTVFMITRTLVNYKRSISLYRDEAIMRHQSELDVKELNRELTEAYETTLEGWAHALELRDKETEGHSRRVTGLCMLLGKKMGMNEEEIKYIRYGSILHDIGKMGIPDAILRKPGSLTPDEWIIVKQHPGLANDLLKHISYLQPALSIPYSHHENWNGTGYPQGLTADAIPLPARIFAVIDNWDALTSDRPYRNAWSREQAAAYIQENRGKLFDARVVDLFMEIISVNDQEISRSFA